MTGDRLEMNARGTSRRGALGMIGAGVAGILGAPVGAWAIGAPGRSAILTRPIPSSGEALPVIGLGTWQTFDVGSDPAARAPLEAVLGSFVELGGKLVDSSPMAKSSRTN